MRLAVAGLAATAALVPGSGVASDRGYLGTWRIVASSPAPWIDAREASAEPLSDRLSGKTVTFAPTRITAPPPLQCRRPRYRLREASLEGLFQGSLTRPGEQAPMLGFTGRTVRTLETGCNGWFEFHFTAADTALFALDNRIYILRRR
uniref:Uncharacterized protein n=1 Tax=uncultured bacterium 5H7 TaxID=1701327 RepID=A0A0N9HMN9_9BACT|nr:hypothetical protein 5H7_049 [uncultured bacterium 5H7]